MSRRKMTVEGNDSRYHKEVNSLLTGPDPNSDGWAEDVPLFLEEANHIPYESLCRGTLTERAKRSISEADGNRIPGGFQSGKGIIDPAMRLACYDVGTGEWSILYTVKEF